MATNTNLPTYCIQMILACIMPGNKFNNTNISCDWCRFKNEIPDIAENT
jgi:hypothetical protein